MHFNFYFWKQLDCHLNAYSYLRVLHCPDMRCFPFSTQFKSNARKTHLKRARTMFSLSVFLDPQHKYGWWTCLSPLVIFNMTGTRRCFFGGYLFVICDSCLSCYLISSLQPCCHLLGNCWPLGSLVCDVFFCFVTFPCGVLGQVWYLIVLILDICLLPYFVVQIHGPIYAPISAYVMPLI